MVKTFTYEQYGELYHVRPIFSAESVEMQSPDNRMVPDGREANLCGIAQFVAIEVECMEARV